jgi:plastocyanin
VEIVCAGMSRFHTAVVALAVLSLAACGEDREGSVEESGTGTTPTGASTTGTSTTPAKPSGAVVARVKVRETEFELDPPNPRIAKAGVVEFDITNAGQAPHALEVEGPKGEVETETIEPGRKATLKADLSKAGTYVWYCPVGDHERRGMKGKITVAGGGSPASTDDPKRTEDSRRDDDSGKRDGSRKRDDSPNGREGTGGGAGDDGPGGY